MPLEIALLTAGLLLLSACTGFKKITGGDDSPNPENPTVHIYLVLGQSNAYRLNPSGHASFALSMRRAGRQVALINCAIGGTLLDEWRPENQLFQDCLNTYEAYRSVNPNSILAGILYHQGEADSAGHNFAIVYEYAEVFQANIIGYRAALGAPNLPVVFAQLGPKTDASGPEWDRIKAEQSDVRLSNTKMIRSDDLALADGLHFTQDSYKILGERYAFAFLH